MDVVFARYPEKQHSPWRNLTSALNERVSDWVLDKPRGFYVSTFRCISGWLSQELGKNTGPFPYIDGLIIQATQRIGTREVSHQKRAVGKGGCTLRKLVRLWPSTIVNFSVMPLRIATILGIAIPGIGFPRMTWVLYTGAPFTSTNFHDAHLPIYPEQFRRNFLDRFELREATAFFDIYLPIKEH